MRTDQSSGTPHQQTKISEIEKVQKRAARFVTGNYEFTNNSTASNLRQLGWATLSDRRAIGKLKMFYKATSGLADIPTSDLIPTAPGTRRGSDEEYRIPYSRVNAHLHSYYPSTLRLWNSLPHWIRGCPDFLSFGSALENHYYKNYTND